MALHVFVNFCSRSLQVLHPLLALSEVTLTTSFDCRWANSSPYGIAFAGKLKTSPWHQHLIFCRPHVSAFASPATPLLLLVYMPYDLSDVDALPLWRFIPCPCCCLAMHLPCFSRFISVFSITKALCFSTNINWGPWRSSWRMTWYPTNNKSGEQSLHID